MRIQAGSSRIKKAFFYLLFSVYFLGGINHFVFPELYWPLIPPYLEYPVELNLISGAAEVLLALGLLFPLYRNTACIGIALLLIAFIPAHVHFIQMGGCISNSLCVAPWVAWVRLLVVHPLLIYWAFSYRKYSLP